MICGTFVTIGGFEATIVIIPGVSVTIVAFMMSFVMIPGAFVTIEVSDVQKYQFFTSCYKLASSLQVFRHT